MDELSQAFINSVKAYFTSDDYDDMESFKGKKYNKKYFDGMKEKLTPPIEPEKKKKGKK